MPGVLFQSRTARFQSTFPRGERLYECEQCGRKWSFNPRSREGNDQISLVEPYSHMLFQSTFPRGERQQFQQMPMGISGFNPRSREGNDAINITQYLRARRVSIHVPARGTTEIYAVDFDGTLFQSTVPGGERINLPDLIVLFLLFQSTFPRGERHI